jgi:hypothetical protein
MKRELLPLLWPTGPAFALVAFAAGREKPVSRTRRPDPYEERRSRGGAPDGEGRMKIAELKETRAVKIAEMRAILEKAKKTATSMRASAGASTASKPRRAPSATASPTPKRWPSSSGWWQRASP